MLGSACGISALLLYTNGLFVAGLSHDFGLYAHLQFGLGVLLVTLVAQRPRIRWSAGQSIATDRKRACPHRAGVPLARIRPHSVHSFTRSGAYLLLGVGRTGRRGARDPSLDTKVIGATFQQRRGMALGITMTGIGCSAAIIPPLLAGVIANQGWRTGFFALAAIPLIGALLTALLIPRSVTRAAHVTHDGLVTGEAPGSWRRSACSGSWRRPSQ